MWCQARRIGRYGRAPALLACTRGTPLLSALRPINGSRSFPRSWLGLTAQIGLILLGSLLASGCRWPVAADRPLVYVALGASDSVGVGTADPAQEGWVPQLHSRLPPGTRLVNLGVSGFRLAEAVEQTLPIAVDADPDIVTIWLAVNDFNARTDLGQYERDLDRLLGALAATEPRVILIGNIPDLTLVPVYASFGVPKEALAAEVDRWNAAIDRQAVKHGARVVDLHAQWLELADHPEYVSADGFHPSASGYRRLADLFYASLEAAGAVR
ncbi:MAG TPA: SGNH/GDSL hydrolase family protein [Dehalococcoidia bacterium]|nr:SGNH/GDSL hydrolase family protein [Dehalococcoidia bacterium]